jgi:hypothetical protein
LRSTIVFVNLGVSGTIHIFCYNCKEPAALQHRQVKLAWCCLLLFVAFKRRFHQRYSASQIQADFWGVRLRDCKRRRRSQLNSWPTHACYWSEAAVIFTSFIQDAQQNVEILLKCTKHADVGVYSFKLTKFLCRGFIFFCILVFAYPTTSGLPQWQFVRCTHGPLCSRLFVRFCGLFNIVVFLL